MSNSPTTFSLEVCRRLPLAEAVLRCWDFIAQEDFLEEVFERYRGASYKKTISFTLFVHLIADALLERDGRAHQSFQRAQEQGTLQASLEAAYGKLRRVPVPLSVGLFVQANARLAGLFPPTACRELPPSLGELDVVIADGKKIKKVAKRLKPLRNYRGQILGGKLLAALDATTGLVAGVVAHPDGEASDNALTPELLEQLPAGESDKPRLWVLDRVFCDLVQPHRFSRGTDHFLIRYCGKVGFHPDPERPELCELDGQGRTCHQRWGWLGPEGDERRLYVRLIHLEMPGDQEDLILVTDLLDPVKYPARDLLQAYQGRWGIEEVYQQVEEVFHLNHLISSTPEGTIFQACYCMLMYNVVQLVRAYVAEGQQRPLEQISTEKLFTDVTRQLISLHETLTVQETVALFKERLSGEQLRARLRQLLHPQWHKRWLKARKRKYNHAQETRDKEYVKGGHDSVFRILERARHNVTAAGQEP